MHRRQFMVLGICACAAPARAAQGFYGLRRHGARINYTFDLGGAPVTGTVPITDADLRIDLSDPTTMHADVTADVRRARTGLPLATQALKSRGMLNARAYPLARFRASQMQMAPGGAFGTATLDGALTLRGVTRPLSLVAALIRPPVNDGTLDMRLHGHIDRSEFGATGYPALVGERVTIAISARMSRLG